MENYISSLNGKTYRLKDLARTIDRRLQTIYTVAGIKPVDIYPSIDDNGKNVIAMMYLRSETSELYQKWRNRELDY